VSISSATKDRWIISQAELDVWLDGISNARTLIAPREVSGTMLYQRVSKSNEISWKELKPGSILAPRPALSIKEVFFPPTERLFTIHKNRNEVDLQETFLDWETVVFGLRPCDAHGIKLLDAIFLDTNPVDIYYSRHRNNTTLIGLACQAPGANCFCTTVGVTPDNPNDVDIMLYGTDVGYLAEAITEKGRFLIPGGEWKETTNISRPVPSSGQFKTPQGKNWPQHFNSDYWDKISERCLSCRVCAYVCPTCRCFMVRDEMVAQGVFERIRCWDSCAGVNYRRTAGGHIPRAEKGERLRNRFLCKFYYFQEQYGQGNSSACTGCGRCIDACPVGVDITEVLMDLE
jgi:sulfhydrogenase subunit beta (sulfur reductase)